MPVLPGPYIHQVVYLLLIRRRHGIQFSYTQHEGRRQYKEDEKYVQEMQSRVEDQLQCGIGEDEKDEADPGRRRGDSFGYKADEQDGKDGHIEKSVNSLYIGIEAIFRKHDKRGNDHGQQTYGHLKTFGSPDKIR